eukprot:s335_g10.t1
MASRSAMTCAWSISSSRTQRGFVCATFERKGSSGGRCIIHLPALVKTAVTTGSSDATADCLDQPLQPQDLVALATHSSSWAEWLVGEDKQLAPVHMRKLSNASSA